MGAAAEKSAATLAELEATSSSNDATLQRMTDKISGQCAARQQERVS